MADHGNRRRPTTADFGEQPGGGDGLECNSRPRQEFAMTITQEIRDRLLAHLGPDHAAAYPRYLEEHYPHVFESIARMWGTSEMAPFLNGLMVTQRSGLQGFSTDAASEIIRLIVPTKLGFVPPAPRQAGDVWDWVADAEYFRKDGGSY
jgi:hypothetical protein